MESTSRLYCGLELLLEAHHYSAETGTAPWEFAVEIADLRALGLHNNDLRWLMRKHYIEQGVEQTTPHDRQRNFEKPGGMLFDVQSCFILTAAGVEFAERCNGAAGSGPQLDPLRRLHPNGILPAVNSKPAWNSGNGSVQPERHPTWDKDRRALWFAGLLIKQFKVPAPNQEIILASFEEENWPPRIDDPLPCHPAIDPKRRLHDTINSLNRNQLVWRLRFHGDGSGEAIRWEASL